MELEQTSELSASARKGIKHVELELTAPMTSIRSSTDDVEYPKRVPTIKTDARMFNPLSVSSSSGSSFRERPRHRNGVSSLVTTDDDYLSSENSQEMEITGPKHSPVRNNVYLLRRRSKTSKYMSTSTSPPPSPPMPTSRTRGEARPFPNTSIKTTYKSISAVLPRPRSSQSSSISNSDQPPVSKKRKTYHRTSPDVRAVLYPKPWRRLSSPHPPTTASASQADSSTLPMLEYDLDRDPTQQVYEFRDQFHERSPFSAILSARFIHAHIFERLSDSTIFDELTKSEDDLVTEFIEPAALSPVSPHDEVSPSYALDSAEVLGNPDPTPAYGDLDLEGAVRVTDPFTVPTMDDVINQQSWGPDAEPVIDPSLLGGTPAFPEPHSPSPVPAPFRNFHSWERTRTPSPPPIHAVLKVRIPPRRPASTSGSGSAQTPRVFEGGLGGGKAKFYKKGTLQTPPHLLSSQRRRSVSTKTTESTHTSRHPSPEQVAFAEIDSPLTELSASDLLLSGIASTSSSATPSEVTNAIDKDATVIGSLSDTPPPRASSTKTVTTPKKKSIVGQKGPHRIVMDGSISYCHQCRNKSSYPKMCCRSCNKRYCILCIVKRYHDIEFHQFKKDFDCPSCLERCNCTACCDKRKEVYVSSRNVRIDGETMAKLLSGEIRSLPHLSGSFAGPRKKLKPGQDPISLRYRERQSTAKREKTPAGRRRVSNRRHASSSDDDDDDDYDDGYDDGDYDESGASKTPDVSVRVKPVQAALQTRRMLEESGGGGCWGAVYSLDGERIGVSYVGRNLQNITLRPSGFSSASVADHMPSPSQKRRKRVYVGRWQDSWGFHPETLDGSYSEDETHANKRSRKNNGLGHARFYYVGNQNVIRAWRKAQSKTIQRPPVSLLSQADDVDPYTHPSNPAPFDKVFDRHEATGASPDGNILNDGEGEDEDDSRSFWIMEDRSSPTKPDPPFSTGTHVSDHGPYNISNALSVCPTSAVESCGQIVPQADMVKGMAAGLQAVGATVSFPEPPLSSSLVDPR